MPDQIDAVLSEVLSSSLKRVVAPGESISREAEAGWDSLKHMEMIFLLEDAFGVVFERDEIGAITSSGDMRALLEKKIAS